MRSSEIALAEPLWTVREAAAFLHLGRNTVYEWAASGKLPSRRARRWYDVPVPAGSFGSTSSTSSSPGSRAVASAPRKKSRAAIVRSPKLDAALNVAPSASITGR